MVTGYSIKGNEMTVSYNDSLGNGEGVKNSIHRYYKNSYTFEDGTTRSFKAVYGVSTERKRRNNNDKENNLYNVSSFCFM